MLHHKLILMCIVHVLQGNRAFICPENNEFVQDYVVAVEYYTKGTSVDPEVVAAVADYESKFKKYARGSHGEIGLHQIKRHGAIQGNDLKRSFRDLADLAVNTRIAVEYMNKMAIKCHNKAILWLSAYNGNGCVSSRYSRTILSNLRNSKIDINRLRYQLRSLPNKSTADKSTADKSQEEYSRTSCKMASLCPTTDSDTHADNIPGTTTANNNWIQIPDPVLVTP